MIAPVCDRVTAVRRTKGESDILTPMPTRTCTVGFVGPSGIRHSVEVEAESLYEAAVLGTRRLNRDIWSENVGLGTVLEIEVREPATRHSISLQQVERWLAGATANPNEASKKAKLKMMLVQG